MKEYYEFMQLIDELDDKYKTSGQLRDLMEKGGIELSDAEFYLKSIDIIASAAIRKAEQNEICNRCKNGYDETNGNGYQPCGCGNDNVVNE